MDESVSETILFWLEMCLLALGAFACFVGFLLETDYFSAEEAFAVFFLGCKQLPELWALTGVVIFFGALIEDVMS